MRPLVERPGVLGEAERRERPDHLGEVDRVDLGLADREGGLRRVDVDRRDVELEVGVGLLQVEARDAAELPGRELELDRDPRRVVAERELDLSLPISSVAARAPCRACRLRRRGA